MVVVHWIRNDVSLFPYLWYIIKYSRKVSRYEEFQGWKGKQDIFHMVSYFIIIIIENYKLLSVDGKTLFTKTWLANIVKILVTV